jgi:hypothetical protein
MAIEIWAGLASEAKGSELPRELIEQVVWAVETRRDAGLHAVTHCARRLVELNCCTAEHRLRLNQSLGDLITETAYEGIDPDSRDAVSASLLRAECVRLARALQNSGLNEVNVQKWLANAAIDPLPEVRYALDS